MKTILLSVFLIFLTLTVFGDVIITKDGQEIKGVIIDQDSEKIKIKNNSGEFDIKKSKIKKVILRNEKFIQLNEISKLKVNDKNTLYQTNHNYIRHIFSIRAYKVSSNHPTPRKTS